MMDNTMQIDINKYLQLIIRRKYIFIVSALLVISVIVWGSYFMPKIYQAECTVFIERNIINNLVKNIAITPSLQGRLGVIRYAMKSRTLLLKVIDKLDLDIESKDIEKLVEQFQLKTSIDLLNKRGGQTDLFTITYKDADQKLARDYVNTLVSLYIEENLSAKREESYEANKFLSQQIKLFRKKLSGVEENIVDYRREKGVFIAMDENRFVLDIKEAQDQLEELKVRRMELLAKKKLILKELNMEKPFAVAMLGKMSGPSLHNRVLLLQNRLNELLVKFTENYPEVIRVKAEIETLQMQMENSPDNRNQITDMGSETEMKTVNPLYQQFKEDLSGINVELAAIEARAKHLNSSVMSKKADLREIPAERKKLAELERERATYQKITEELAFKLGQSEVSKQMEVQDKTETFRIVDPAILPNQPISPNRVMIIIFGLIAGILAGFGVVILLDTNDHSVKNVDTLKESFNLPVVAVIPVISTDEDIAKRRKVDRTVYAFSILYLTLIGGVLIKEILDRIV
jgi:polysaccharide chain length determinant protein (PEP-CTERM system associated)